MWVPPPASINGAPSSTSSVAIAVASAIAQGGGTADAAALSIAGAYGVSGEAATQTSGGRVPAAICKSLKLASLTHSLAET